VRARLTGERDREQVKERERGEGIVVAPSDRGERGSERGERGHIILPYNMLWSQREGRGQCCKPHHSPLPTTCCLPSPLRERGGATTFSPTFSPTTFPIGYNIPHTAVYVSSQNCLCPHTAMSVPSYYCMLCSYEEERQLECVCVCVCVCVHEMSI
jgi:hypothetical protein